MSERAQVPAAATTGQPAADLPHRVISRLKVVAWVVGLLMLIVAGVMYWWYEMTAVAGTVAAVGAVLVYLGFAWRATLEQAKENAHKEVWSDDARRAAMREFSETLAQREERVLSDGLARCAKGPVGMWMVPHAKAEVSRDWLVEFRADGTGRFGTYAPRVGERIETYAGFSPHWISDLAWAPAGTGAVRVSRPGGIEGAVGVVLRYTIGTRRDRISGVVLTVKWEAARPWMGAWPFAGEFDEVGGE